MKPLSLVAATLALGLASGCTMQDNSMRQTARADRMPAARPTGAAVSCIPIAQISDSQVRDDRTIDFRLGANRYYRNVLPYSCSGLGFERAFSYNTSQSQLCSTDIIHVVQQTGGSLQPGASCGLGQFQPIELERRR